MSSFFHTWENGEVEFMGTDEDRIALHNRLGKYNRNGVIKSTLESIKELRLEIETFFEKIE